MTAALDRMITAVDSALADPSLPDERARLEHMRPAMQSLLDDPDPVDPAAYSDLDGQAVGNLLYADPAGRFHVLAVVFPEGTSSGVHHHGCWGLIGYLRGGDEETRYAGPPPSAGMDAAAGPEGDVEPVQLAEASRHVWHRGDITFLIPEEGEGWHRVRNPGPGTGVSIHVLCRLPATHPHHLWERSTGRVRAYPFAESRPGRWRALPAGQ